MTDRLQNKSTTAYIEKAVEGNSNRFRFILSDESVDRVGDIIRAKGWQLKNFLKNPVALAYHDHTKVVGRWHKVKIEGKKLVGELELAPDDTGPFQRAINSLVRNGFLKAVSVGFSPIEYKPRDKDSPYKGYIFEKQELQETSIVAVPANANALSFAKSLDLSQEQLSKLFSDETTNRIDKLIQNIDKTI